MAGKQSRTDIDFEEFRQLLLAERTRILSLHQEQRADMLAESADSSENELAGADYNEPGDVAAELADRDRDAVLDANLLEELHAIEHALNRLEDGNYGICEVTGKPIPVDRLRAIPWATMTVEA